MKKKLKKLFVIFNTLAVAVLCYSSLGGNVTKVEAYTVPEIRLYDSETNERIDLQDNQYFINDDTIDILFPSEISDNYYYNVSIGEVSATMIKTEYLRDFDISSLDDGRYSFYIERVDATDNKVTDIYTYSFVVDREAPEFSRDNELRIDDGTSSSDELSGSGSFRFYFSQENNSDIAGYKVYYKPRYGSEVYVEDLDPDETSDKLYASGLGFGDGRYDIIVYCYDKAGNMDDSIDEKVYYDSDGDLADITDLNFSVQINGMMYKIKPGDVIYLPENELDSNKFDLVYNINFNGDAASYSLNGFGDAINIGSSNNYTNTTPLDLSYGAYNISVSGTTTFLDDGDEKTVTSSSKTINFEIKEDGTEPYDIDLGYYSPSLSGSVITIEPTSLTSGNTIPYIFLQKLYIDNDISYFSVDNGSNWVKGNVNDLVNILRNLSSGESRTIKVRNKHFQTSNSFTINVGTETTITMPIGSYASLDFGGSDEDINPINGITSEIEVAYNYTGLENFAYTELIVNDKVVKISTNITDDYTYLFKTLSSGDIYEDIKLIVYTHDGTTDPKSIVASSIVKTLYEHVEDIVIPYATVDKTTCTYDSITATVTVYDQGDDIDRSKVVLYDESADRIVAEKSLSVGSNLINFTNLYTRGEYTIKVLAEYGRVDYEDDEAVINGSDIDDSLAYTDLELNTMRSSDDVTAKINDIEFDNLPNDKSNLTFEVESELQDETSTDELEVRLEYYDTYKARYVNLDEDDIIALGNVGYDKYFEISTRRTTDKNDIDINGLDINTFYHLEILDGDTILATANFTPSSSAPSGILEITGSSDTTVDLETTFISGEDDIDEATIYVFEDDEDTDYIWSGSTDDGREVTVRGLEEDTDYRAELRIDFEQGSGIISDYLAYTLKFKTGKISPTITYDNVIATGTTITFDYSFDDPQDSVEVAKAVLYQNGSRVIGQEITLMEGDHADCEFADITPDEEYQIRTYIEYRPYGTDEIVTQSNYTNPDGTLAAVDVYATKLIPVAQIDKIQADYNQISVTAYISDDYNSFVKGSIKIYRSGSASPIKILTINDEELKTFTFTNLNPDTEYEIRIDVYYQETEDAVSKFVNIYKKTVSTLKELDATHEILEYSSEDAKLDIYVTNNLDYEIENRVYLDGVLLQSQALSKGSNAVDLTGLEPQTKYVIRTVAIDNNGNEQILKTTELTTKAESSVKIPTFEITSSNVVDNQAVMTFSIKDPDSVITPNIIYIEVKASDGSLTTYQFNIDEYQINNEVRFTLPYNNNSVKAYIKYDTTKEVGTIDQNAYFNNIDADNTDNSNVIIYGAIAILSVATIALAVALIRKK